MTTPRTTLSGVFAEKKTAKITATMKDEDGDALALANVDTMVLTLYEESGGSIINSRDGSDIKNTGGGTLAATSGAFTLTLSPSDMAIIQTTLTVETHVALVEWTYNSAADAGGKEIAFKVQNLTKVS